jgi:uncharacterized protein
LSEPGLPRRGFVGLQIEPLPDQAPGARGSTAGSGLLVRAVSQGSSAHRAGARVGDRLIAISDTPIGEINTARRLLRELRTGEALRVHVLRGTQTLELTGVVRPFPVEQHAHAVSKLLQVNVGETRLRAIALVPETPGPHPVLYYLPGAHWASEEYPFAPSHPVPALLGYLAERGVASLRVERFGMGDSEGPPCNVVDFEQELRGYGAGLDLLGHTSWCDPTRVVLMGHSLGAMVAPLLATNPTFAVKVAGIVTFGASAIPICDGLEGALQRYRTVQSGVSQETIALQCELIGLIVRQGKTPAQVLQERPDLRAVTPEHFTDDSIYRRTVSFYHQLQAQQLTQAWAQFDKPLLALHGSHDWICAAEDSQRIATLTQHGESRQVSSADHQFAHSAVDRLLADQPLRLAASVARDVSDWLATLFATNNGPRAFQTRR